MAAGMEKLKSADEEKLTLQPILLAYVWRMIAALLVGAILAALIYRFAWMRAGVRRSIVRTVLAGLGAALIGILASWISGQPLAAIAAVSLVFGIPAAIKHKRPWVPFVTWVLCALPAVLVTIPIL